MTEKTPAGPAVALGPSTTITEEAPAGPPGKYGPEFVRNAYVELEKLSVSAGVSGWRDADPEHIQELATTFTRGGWGMPVLRGPQMLEKEHDGKKILDDGCSTVAALLSWLKDMDRDVTSFISCPYL